MNQPPRIGIVGGGQLGKMLTIAAKKLGFYVAVIDPTPNSPAGQVADKQIVADYKDENAIRQLSEITDYITFEIELANDQVLTELIQKGKYINPSPQTLSIIRDKLKQKKFLRDNKIPTADFLEVKTTSNVAEAKEDIFKTAKIFGYPLVLKARTDAYDGRGNAIIRYKKAIDKAIDKLKDRALYIEKFVPFKKELAVMVARSTKGDIAVYPVVETIHRDNICDTVLAPARISQRAKKNAQKLARKTMMQLQGAGVFGIEMFLLKNDNVLINEIAPRVHNSGHYTIEASFTSQFEQHIRAVTGLPLGVTDMITKAVVMKNILGTGHGDGFPEGLEKALKVPDVSIHIYSKKESRPARKMGHITVVGKTINECLRKANKARRALTI